MLEREWSRSPGAGKPVGSNPSEDVTRLLGAMAKGDRGAVDQLLPLVYGELRALAARAMNGQAAGHTLQATALVHEAYLRLMQPRDGAWEGRAHFLRVAAKAMRCVLIDHARARGAGKRGGGRRGVPLEESAVVAAEPSADVLAIDEALGRLAALDAPKAEIVELRFFGGLGVDETARVVGASPATVKRQWRLAKAWLHRELGGGDGASQGGGGREP